MSAAPAPAVPALAAALAAGFGAQMVSSSLVDVQAAVQASADEASWITTAPGMAQRDRLLGRAAAPAPAVELAEGRDLTLLFEARRCIHARFCVLGEPAAFRANVVGPWPDPDAASSTAGLIAVAHACPSGAIRYRRKDGGPEEALPPVNLVRLRENGPLAVQAELVLDGAPAGTRATLCRCGASASKPFCDGSHVRAGFAATGEPPTGDVAALEARNGPLEVRPQPNGPLALSGALEVVSGTGRTVLRARAAMLCRCGHSASKPFCDGSHARLGFRS